MEIKNFCPCTKVECPLHSNCKACIMKHKQAQQIPHCLFPNNKGDRSISHFYTTLKEIYEKN